MAVDPRCHYVERSLKLDGARISERLTVIRRERSEFAARFASAMAPGDPATSRQGARGKRRGAEWKNVKDSRDSAVFQAFVKSYWA